MWKKVESMYITMGKNTFLKQRNKKMIQNYVQFLKTFLAASLLKYLFFKYVSFLNLFQYWTNVCFKFISLARDSGMFYDGNHTYLIEPDENYTSDVSRTSGSPAVIFFLWNTGIHWYRSGIRLIPLITNSLTQCLSPHNHRQK